MAGGFGIRKMERKQYSDQTKAAVMAALLAGQSVSQVASEYKIPESTLRSWKLRHDDVASIGRKKREEIGELLLDYLRATLQTLRIQAEHFGDKAWLAKQEAQQLAVLHGVATDKAIRLLEALADDADDADATLHSD